MHIIQLTSSNTRRIKFLKAHQLRGGKIIVTNHRHCARKFKSEAEAQVFVDKVSVYYLRYNWTVVPAISQLVINA